MSDLRRLSNVTRSIWVNVYLVELFIVVAWQRILSRSTLSLLLELAVVDHLTALSITQQKSAYIIRILPRKTVCTLIRFFEGVFALKRNRSADGGFDKWLFGTLF